MKGQKNETVSIEDSRQRDIAKYGDKDDDVIARSYREGRAVGDVWCAKNVEKYLRRFIGDSHKSHNLVDLEKSKMYLERMIEANQDLRRVDIQEK